MLDQIFDTFTDATVYFCMGAVGTAIFVIKIVLMFAFGMDDSADFDADMDIDADGGMEAHGADFSLFSLLSIISFMMGAGWMGLMCSLEWQLGQFISAMIASGFGFALMMLASSGMYMMRRMQQSGHYEPRHSIGKIGRVYLKIPPKGKGRGQVEITVDGRRQVMPAVTGGEEEIESFVGVKVLDVQGTDTLVVERQT